MSYINAQLEAQNIIVKNGIILDASVVETPLRPKGETNSKVTEDRSEQVVNKKHAESLERRCLGKEMRKV